MNINKLYENYQYYFKIYEYLKERNDKRALAYYKASNYYYSLYQKEKINKLENINAEDYPKEIRMIADSMDLNTNWSDHSIPYKELTKLQNKAGIVKSSELVGISASNAAKWIKDEEPVIVAKVNGTVKAYPVKILLWNPVINDLLGGESITITYYPLCNITFVYNRKVHEVEGLYFGFSGMLRNSCVVFYDNVTESLWDSLTGECLAGDFTGNVLKHIPSKTISFKRYRENYPNGSIVVKLRSGILRPIGKNPYIAYDLIKKPLFFFKDIDRRLPAMERVVGLWNENASVCYPYSAIIERQLIEDDFNGEPIIIYHRFGMYSPLSDPIENGRDIGAASVLSPYVDGVKLSFYVEDDKLFDMETQSEWSILGNAISGHYKGKQLNWIRQGDTFWFVWAAYFPDVIIFNR